MGEAVTPALCGEKHWEDNLENIEMQWFNQPGVMLLCEGCLAGFRRTEESDEDLDDTAYLLASAMHGATNDRRALFDGDLDA